jgi:hypothetical protein
LSLPEYRSSGVLNQNDKKTPHKKKNRVLGVYSVRPASVGRTLFNQKKIMRTIYFKFVVQKTAEGKSIFVAVIPDDMLGEDLPSIVEGQAFLMPATIYTGTYPQIKINTDTIEDRTEDFKGLGISGIITSAEWYIKSNLSDDTMGISL